MLKRIVTSVTIIALAIGSVGLIQTGSAFAKKDEVPVAVPGNNGTLKVHEKGMPLKNKDNDPKICVFNFEGFDFDDGQSGVIKVEPQGNDSGTTDSVTIPFGPTDDDGYAQTVYVNDGGLQLDNGHYKSTLYGKDANGGYTIDLKAKSKVFKVECADVQPEGKSKYKLKCELLKLKAPKSIQPEDASYQYYLDGQAIALGNHDLAAGEYTLTLKVNGVLVDTDEVTIEACDDGVVLTPNTSVVVVCPVDGLNVELTFTNTGTAASNVTVNGTPYVVAAGATVVATVPKAAVVNLTIVIDGEPAEPTTVTCPTGGSGGNGETPTTPTTPVTVVVNGGAGEVVSLPVTSGSNDKIAAIVTMIGAVLATIAGYVVRMRYAAQL